MRRALFTGVGLLSLAALSACNPWGDLPDNGSYYLDDALWDAEVVAAADGVYARLPSARKLVRVTPEGSSDVVDLGAYAPRRLLPTPDGAAVLAFTDAPVCDTQDEDIETVEDCLDELGDDFLSDTYALSIIRDGKEDAHFDISVPFNAVQFTADGQTAVAYLDYTAGQDLDIDGALNLTEVLFIDVGSGEARSVPVGFSADRVLFNADETKAVVLSRSQVVVVNLASGDYETLVTYPLTLDADDSVSPLDAALTPDGRYALITIEGSGDLYILDLEVEAINLVSLDSAPSDMVVDAVSDRTAIVYSGRSEVDVLEHQYFDVETIQLEEPATDVLNVGGIALLHNISSSDRHDLYRLDLESGELVEMRMENPVTRLELSPDSATAVAFMRPEKVSSGNTLEGYYDENYGVAIVDFWTEDIISLVTESQPLGLAFADGDIPVALVLLAGQDDLLQLDLGTGTHTEVRLEEPPLDIGSYGDGQFYITHDTSMGMVSFLDPDSGNVSVTANFAAQDLLGSDIPLLLE